MIVHTKIEIYGWVCVCVFVLYILLGRGIPQEELGNVAVERDIWTTYVSLL